jgi:hypothetical protein
MEQIIKSLSAKLNLPESVVRSGVGILLNFIKQKAVGTEFEKFAAMIPGADSTMAAAPGPGEGGEAGGLLGGLLGKAGGLLGGNLGGAAEALGSLQKAGIPMDKAIPLASGFFEQAKEVAGPETVNELLEQIPALKSLLGGKA